MNSEHRGLICSSILGGSKCSSRRFWFLCDTLCAYSPSSRKEPCNSEFKSQFFGLTQQCRIVHNPNAKDTSSRVFEDRDVDSFSTRWRKETRNKRPFLCMPFLGYVVVVIFNLLISSCVTNVSFAFSMNNVVSHESSDSLLKRTDKTFFREQLRIMIKKKRETFIHFFASSMLSVST